MQKERIGNLSLYKFDSFYEYLQRAALPEFKRPQTHYSSGWGTKDWEQQLHYAKNGWSDVIADIDKWRNLVVADITSQLPRPEVAYDKQGAFWDIGRILEGDPDCWVDEVPSQDIYREGKGNIIRIVINTASSAAVRTAFHTRRCGVILAVSQLLETAGFHTQIEITTAIGVYHGKVEFRTIAKKPSEALNTATLAYWASQYMEHNIDFAICETIPECASGSWTHYGYPTGTYDQGDICFDRGTNKETNWKSDAQAREYIVWQLAKNGIILEKTK